MSNSSETTLQLKKEWLNLIRTEAIIAEKQGKLTARQLSLIYEQGWFKMLMPTIYGGKQISLLDAMQLQEELAKADGSIAWVVTLCSGAGWFGGMMNETFATQQLKEDKVCLAGSGSTGTAKKTKTGYVLNGNWPYASGAPDATLFTVNCVVTSNGEAVQNEQGVDKILSFAVLKSEVKVTQEWNGMGMAATASHSFEIKDLAVGADRAFDINIPTVDAPLYRYPFLQLAEATLAINMVGMGLRFMELCREYITSKSIAGTMPPIDLEELNATYDTLAQKLAAAREKLYYAVDMSWQVCQANKVISTSVLYKVSLAAAGCVNTVRDCVHILYPFCGLKAVNRDSEINRVWRDIQTAGQHTLLVTNKIM